MIKVIGTHNGIFHCDEVLAVAMLSIINRDIKVIRSRDIDILKQADLLVDIGGGRYDHHQKGGNGKRANGIKYASAGLIWRDYGSQVVSLLANGKLSEEEAMIVANTIDEEVIQKVDMEDNGQSSIVHPFQFITSFIPNWNEEADYDKAFEECVNLVIEILKKNVKMHIALHLAKNEIFNRIKNQETHIENILVLPSQTIPWKEEITRHNINSEEKIDFVVFPYPAGGFALQCVPPSPKEEDQFLQRIPLPDEWAGETTELPRISGISSATFCHNGKFFARANEYADIIIMGQTATAIHKAKQTKNTDHI